MFGFGLLSKKIFERLSWATWFSQNPFYAAHLCKVMFLVGIAIGQLENFFPQFALSDLVILLSKAQHHHLQTEKWYERSLHDTLDGWFFFPGQTWHCRKLVCLNFPVESVNSDFL